MSGNGRGPTRPKTRGRARRERSAGGVVFRVAAGRPMFLLIRDSYGHWGFPKGHVERGERAEKTALREVMEETGLRRVNLVGPIEDIEWFFRLHGALIHKHCRFFLMESESTATTPQTAEGITECRWMALEDAQRHIEYANAQGVLAHAADMVEARAASAAD